MKKNRQLIGEMILALAGGWVCSAKENVYLYIGVSVCVGEEIFRFRVTKTVFFVLRLLEG